MNLSEGLDEGELIVFGGVCTGKQVLEVSWFHVEPIVVGDGGCCYYGYCHDQWRGKCRFWGFPMRVIYLLSVPQRFQMQGSLLQKCKRVLF